MCLSVFTPVRFSSISLHSLSSHLCQMCESYTFIYFPHVTSVNAHDTAFSPFTSSVLPPSSVGARSPLPCVLAFVPPLLPPFPAPRLAATISPPPPSALHCECLVQQPQPLLQYAASLAGPLLRGPKQPPFTGLRGTETLRTAGPSKNDKTMFPHRLTFQLVWM